MIDANTMQFLNKLNNNNNKIWFDENRKIYENVKSIFYYFVDNIIEAVAKFDETINNLKAKDCVFRINRDVRFSKDKSPYKNNFGASISKGGKKINCAGYYLHIEPGKCFVAGGFYMPSPLDLNKIRQEIDYNFNEWQLIINNKEFKKYFKNGVEGIDTLIRTPKGYDDNNPAIEYLKMKGFIVRYSLTDAEIISKLAIKNIEKIFKQMLPLINYLNNAIL